MRYSQRLTLGFTLVELLVVIGIIALLIAFLMPSLMAARQAAQRVACSAKLHNMMVAAQMHASDHKGFFPLAGVLPGSEPQELDDVYSSKYDYTSYQFYSYIRMIAPVTIGLAAEMTYGHALLAASNDAIGAAETDDGGFIRNFICPSQASSVSELEASDVNAFGENPLLYAGTDSIMYMESQSYIYNEAVLGWGKQGNSPSGRLRGQVSQIRQPTRTMFAADGVGGSVYSRTDLPYFTGLPMMTVYNALDPITGVSVSPTMTLADAFMQKGLAGDKANFDLLRHRGKINIAFCDGHVETRYITNSNGTGCPDLQSVYLLAP